MDIRDAEDSYNGTVDADSRGSARPTSRSGTGPQWSPTERAARQGACVMLHSKQQLQSMPSGHATGQYAVQISRNGLLLGADTRNLEAAAAAQQGAETRLEGDPGRDSHRAQPLALDLNLSSTSTRNARALSHAEQLATKEWALGIRPAAGRSAGFASLSSHSAGATNGDSTAAAASPGNDDGIGGALLLGLGRQQQDLLAGHANPLLLFNGRGGMQGQAGGPRGSVPRGQKQDSSSSIDPQHAHAHQQGQGRQQQRVLLLQALQPATDEELQEVLHYADRKLALEGVRGR